MSEQTHTQEPWIVLEEVNETSSSQLRGPSGQEICMRIYTGNAYRIAASVNACAGMRDPEAAIKTMREGLIFAIHILEAHGHHLSEDGKLKTALRMAEGKE